MKGKYSARDGFTERSDQRSAKFSGGKNAKSKQKIDLQISHMTIEKNNS